MKWSWIVRSTKVSVYINYAIANLESRNKIVFELIREIKFVHAHSFGLSEILIETFQLYLSSLVSIS